jgi:FkbM family methyltransferase
MGLIQTLRFIVNHPLNADDRAGAVKRYLRWQLAARLAREPIIVDFVDGAKLVVSPGQTGATGNVYVGLHELDEMAFVLHALRADDLFVDVGANVGAYTVLAAAAVGATCVSFEPGAAACAALMRNIRENHVDGRTQLIQAAVGASEGTVAFTSRLDTVNHVLSEDSDESGATLVPMTTLDAALEGRHPALIKIDVEGFESQVVRGAARTLQNDTVLAVIMETNDSGRNFGFDPHDLHDTMIRYGFTACRYNPFTRELLPRPGATSDGNTIYVRNPSQMAARVQAAPRFRVAGRHLI